MLWFKFNVKTESLGIWVIGLPLFLQFWLCVNVLGRPNSGKTALHVPKKFF